MSIEIDFPRTMSPLDATFWFMEGDPVLRSTTAAVALLDRVPDRALVAEKLERASLLIPRLRQRVLVLPTAISAPVWSEDPYFDIDYHVRRIAVPACEDWMRAILDFAAATAMQAFDLSRPLWEFTIVEGLPDGRAALVQKLHHAVTDGSGGVAMMKYVFDRGPEVCFDELPEIDPHHRAPEEGVLGAIADAVARRLRAAPRAAVQQLGEGLGVLRDPLGSARRLFDEAVAMGEMVNSGDGPHSPVMRERSSRYRFDVFSVSATGMKNAAHKCDCKFTDAFLCAVAGGWRTYHEQHHAVPTTLRAAVPFNVRDPRDATVAGNAVEISRFDLPIAEPDPARRMRELRELTTEKRESMKASTMGVLAGVVNMLPSSISLPLFRSEACKGDFVATAVQGLPIPLYMGGAKIESLFTFGPPAGTAANITLFTYLDHAGVALNVDPAAVRDLDRLVGCMKAAFDEVVKLA